MEPKFGAAESIDNTNNRLTAGWSPMWGWMWVLNEYNLFHPLFPHHKQGCWYQGPTSSINSRIIHHEPNCGNLRHFAFQVFLEDKSLQHFFLRSIDTSKRSWINGFCNFVQNDNIDDGLIFKIYFVPILLKLLGKLIFLLKLSSSIETPLLSVCTESFGRVAKSIVGKIYLMDLLKI